MDTETIGSTENEQEWIRKYRAALDVPSRKKSNLKAAGAIFGKVKKNLILALRSVLTKRPRPIPVVSAHGAKTVLDPTSPTPDQRLQGGQSPVVKSVLASENTLHLDAEIQGKAS